MDGSRDGGVERETQKGGEDRKIRGQGMDMDIDTCQFEEEEMKE